MAGCEEALTNLYQYLDRELETVTSEEIRFHLEECSGCLQRFDFEGKLKQVVRERLAEDVPDEFIERLRDAISRERIAEV